MQTGEKVKVLKPTGTYLHITPENPSELPFHEYVAFFTESIYQPDTIVFGRKSHGKYPLSLIVKGLFTV